MSRLDDFTLNVLCNSEVIDVNQDPLGKQARVVRKTADEFILAKPLEGGGVAVGLFNLSRESREITARLDALGAPARCRVRDVWRQKDTGRAAEQLRVRVNPHGVAMLRLS